MMVLLFSGDPHVCLKCSYLKTRLQMLGSEQGRGKGMLGNEDLQLPGAKRSGSIVL